MEYKVIVCKVKEMENEMNNLAKEGWRVLTVSPDIAKLYGVVIVFERNKNQAMTESRGVITSGLRTWEAEDVLAVHDALTRAHESINKLALVPESF